MSIVALAFVLLLQTDAHAQVVINEYSCSNRSIPDAFGNFEDWVELYNPSGQAVDLTGFYLSDNPNNPTKWQFPGGSVPAGGRLVVVCSGRNAMQDGTPHTSFRLNQLQPESVVLTAPNGTVLESHVLQLTQNGHSHGRATDGASTWGVFATPTRGTANSGHSSGYVSTPVLSQQAGFYGGSLSVTMSTTSTDAIIRYTTNGNEPTMVSTQYSGPLSISATTVVKAKAFSSVAGVLPSFTETNTYFINVNHTMPVVSIAGNELPTLLGGSQIDPIGSFEYFDASGVFRDESVGDFNKHGNDSWAYPQRGVDFIARDEYGYNDEIQHKLFSTTDRDRFKRLILKAGASDNYPTETGGAHIRDPYVQTLSQLGGLHLDERSSSFCVVYLNGSYHGLYDMREKVDDHDFTEHYYGQERLFNGSTEYVQFIKTWGGTWAEYGEDQALNDWAILRNFVENNNMGNAGNYAYVTGQLDLESMVDYFILNSFIVNQDWLNWNTGWWRGLNPEGDAKKWRYILWDLDACFGHYVNYTGIPNSSPSADPCDAENLPDPGGQGHTNIISKLINENETAHQHYVLRYTTLMNTVFSCTNMLAVLDSMVAVMQPEMTRHTSRWGGSVQGWLANVQQMRNFIDARCVSVTEGVADCYDLEGPFDLVVKVEPPGTGLVYMNTLALPTLPFQATVYGGMQTDFQAEPTGTYVFDHWELPNHNTTTGPGANGITVGFTQGDTLVAHFKPAEVDNRTIIYYWHFNSLNTAAGDVTAIDADYSLIPAADPKMRYTGTGNRDIDAFDEGTLLNVQLSVLAGQGARVRNRAEGRTLIFNMPTTGYSDMVFQYAVQRSGSGMLNNIVSYSEDGTNYISTGLTQSVFPISEAYDLVTVDMAGIPQVNNNPNFHVRISFSGNTELENGNNRYDNITLKGNLTQSIGLDKDDKKLLVSVYPNPFESSFRLVANDQVTAVRVYNVAGMIVAERFPHQVDSVELQAAYLSSGMYFIAVTTPSGTAHVRVVRQ